MKKYFFLISVAALAMTACTNESDEYVGSQEAKEIAFTPFNQTATRAAVQGTTFPTTNTMEVKAYQTQPTTAEYFPKTTFSREEITMGVYKWRGSTKRYWPLSAAKINFFAVSGAGVDARDITIANALASATIEYDATASNNPSNTAYSATTQSDIMYAFGRDNVTQDGSGLHFPDDVDMEFHHALALINFQIKAGDEASQAIQIYKIELNGARYTGDLTITNTNAATESDTWSAKVDWTPNDVVNNVIVPNIGNTTTPIALTTSYVPDNSDTEDPADWASLMIIPTQQKDASPVSYGFTTFKIYYKYDNKDYDITYAPSGYSSYPTPTPTYVDAGKKYTYKITMTLHEILVEPTVDDWDNASGSPFSVDI